MVLAPLSSEKLTQTVDAVEKAVKSVKGKVVENIDWGEKPFAYTIQKYEKGVYRHMVVELPGEGVAELKGKIKHLHNVLRSLLVVTE